jgi:hypothetical protein
MSETMSAAIKVEGIEGIEEIEGMERMEGAEGVERVDGVKESFMRDCKDLLIRYSHEGTATKQATKPATKQATNRVRNQEAREDQNIEAREDQNIESKKAEGVERNIEAEELKEENQVIGKSNLKWKKSETWRKVSEKIESSEMGWNTKLLWKILPQARFCWEFHRNGQVYKQSMTKDGIEYEILNKPTTFMTTKITSIPMITSITSIPTITSVTMTTFESMQQTSTSNMIQSQNSNQNPNSNTNSTLTNSFTIASSNAISNAKAISNANANYFKNVSSCNHLPLQFSSDPNRPLNHSLNHSLNNSLHHSFNLICF